MSQPYDRGAKVPQPGALDKSLGEFWVENPWDIISKGHNLSAYDAVYVALAEVLDAQLLTRDKRVATAPGHQARVELV